MTTIITHPFAHIMGGAYSFVGISFPEDREAEQAQRVSDGLLFTSNLCGGTCDHCGTAIQIVVQIRGAKGIFKVGSNCAAIATQSPAVIDLLKKQIAARNTKQRKAKAAVEFAAAIEWLESSKALLNTKPHPRGFQNLSLLDYLEWYRLHSGKSKFVSIVRSIQQELT